MDNEEELKEYTGLEKWRVLKDITWTDMSKQIGISRKHLWGIVKGDVANPSLKTIRAIKHITGLDPDNYLP
jgi:transcriptional regulator with XRE-family HTH domain